LLTRAEHALFWGFHAGAFALTGGNFRAAAFELFLRP
jgi:hypothetical protein